MCGAQVEHAAYQRVVARIAAAIRERQNNQLQRASSSNNKDNEMLEEGDDVVPLVTATVVPITDVSADRMGEGDELEVEMKAKEIV